MVMADGNEEEKSRLAIEIHSLSAKAIACADNHRVDRKRKKPPFIDWYLVLRVNEGMGVDGIKKQYHKLALLLHPDKNKHSKAESAFKLVSEAYFCLSDNARRAVFDSQRKIFSCTECNSSIRIQRGTKIQSPPSANFEIISNSEAHNRAPGQTQRGGTYHREMSGCQCIRAEKRICTCHRNKNRNTCFQPFRLQAQELSPKQINQSQEAGRFTGCLYDRKEIHAEHSQEKFSHFSTSEYVSCQDVLVQETIE